eukprot:5324429-Prymnesium_polylepis.1
MALEERALDAARLLLEANADPELGNKDIGMDNSPLLDAARRGDAATIALLLEHRADVNRVGKDGWTPLLVAARAGAERAARLLLEAGADKDARLSNGKGGKEIALVNKKPATAALYD